MPKLHIRTADALAAIACAGVLAIGLIMFGYGRSLIRKNAEIAAGLAQAQLSLGDVQGRLARIEQWRSKSAKIRLLFPELTDTDIASLDEAETSLVPFVASPKAANFERALSPRMATRSPPWRFPCSGTPSELLRLTKARLSMLFAALWRSGIEQNA
jgi:hypothetical protein